MKDSHLTLRLPEELARALEQAAAARGVAKSSIVREAVSHYLAEAPLKPSRPGMTVDAFIRRWETLPKLSPAEAEAYASDIEVARAELMPLRDSWE